MRLSLTATVPVTEPEKEKAFQGKAAATATSTAIASTIETVSATATATHHKRHDVRGWVARGLGGLGGGFAAIADGHRLGQQTPIIMHTQISS